MSKCLIGTYASLSVNSWRENDLCDTWYLEWLWFYYSDSELSSVRRRKTCSGTHILLNFLLVLQFSSVQLLSHVWLFIIPWTAARQASLSITNSRSPHKPMSIELVMPYNHLILCHPLLHLPSIFPSIRVFSNESALSIRWPKYWSFSFNISPSNKQTGLISFRMDWLISLQARGLSRIFSNTTVQKHQFFSAQLSL